MKYLIPGQNPVCSLRLCKGSTGQACREAALPTPGAQPGLCSL